MVLRLISNELAVDILDQLDSGLSKAFVAEDLNISLSSVTRVARKHKSIDVRANGYSTLKKVFNVGVNDSEHPASRMVNGKQIRCEIYSIWINMLRRCYDIKYQKRFPSYVDCFVCSEWIFFSKFREWVLQRDYIGKCLDKDLINPGNKIYSPTSCEFVSSELNNIIVDNSKANKKTPCGVFVVKDKFLARYAGFYLGTYKKKAEADFVYKKAKERRFIELINKQTNPLIILGLNKHKALIWR